MPILPNKADPLACRSLRLLAFLLFTPAACGGAPVPTATPHERLAPDPAAGISAEVAAAPPLADDAKTEVLWSVPQDRPLLGDADANSGDVPAPAALLVPLTGDALTGYRMTIALDEQPLAGLVDTGSSTLAFAGDDCANCPPSVTRWHRSPSAALRAAPSRRLAFGHYADDSGWRGEVTPAHVTLPGKAPFGGHVQAWLNAGWITAHSGDFYPTASGGEAPWDGIVGLGPAAGASLATQALIPTLLADAELRSRTFALHLRASDGLLWLRGAARPSPRQLHWLPMQGSAKTAKHYLARLLEVRLGERVLPLPAQSRHALQQGTDLPGVQTAIDTGTLALLLPEVTYAALKQALLELPAVSDSLGAAAFDTPQPHCQVATSAGTTTQVQQLLDQALPPLTLVFADVDGQRWSLQRTASQSYLAVGTKKDTAAQKRANVAGSIADDVTCSAAHDSAKDCVGDVASSVADDGTKVVCVAVFPSRDATLGAGVLRDILVVFDLARWRLGLAVVPPSAQ